MKRFILPDCFKTNVINGRVFDEDRSIVVSDDDAVKLERTLVAHYGCTMEDVEPEPSEEGEETSLVSTVTKDPA